MLTISKNLRIIALGAHPDDIELSCGGSLLRLNREFGAEIITLIFSRGELKSDPKIRSEEQARAGKYLKVTTSKILNHKDGSILADSRLVSEIEESIRQQKPDLIFTHCLEDIHQDHRNIAWATLSATRRIKTGYPVLPFTIYPRSIYAQHLY